MTKEDIRLPETFTEYEGEGIMSNFDHAIIEATATAIKGKDLWSDYAGWEFNGKVWWHSGQWHCEIWRYRSYMETISEETLPELMESVCDKWGCQ